MRFLVVYQDFIKPCRDLLDRLGVEDVEIICIFANESSLRPEILRQLSDHPNASLAICQVGRKIKQGIPGHINIDYETKKFRVDDQLLQEWLIRSRVNFVSSPEHVYVKPSEIFQSAIQQTNRIILAEGALDQADRIEKHRWRFIERSANLLVRLSNGEDLGAQRDWKSRFNVAFAGNGKVSYKYRISHGGRTIFAETEWHLKEGDNTSPESAARIYFDRIQLENALLIYVFYVGPHPAYKCYTAHFK